MGNYDVILSFTKNTATAGSCDTLPAVAVFVLCKLPIIPEGKENQGNYQNAIGDRSSNQHPYKEKFSRQTKTENTAHHGQALSVYLPTNWNHRRICTKKQTQGEMIPLESISHYVSDSDFGRTNTRISKIRWCSTRVTVTSSVS